VELAVDEVIGKFFQKNFRINISNSKKTTRFITSRSGSKIGLGKFIVGYDFAKHEVILTSDDIQVSPAFKKKMEEALDLLLPDRKRKRGATTYTS
jgi:hypothetical protein